MSLQALQEVSGVGDRAFERFGVGARGAGTVVVLKGARLFVFDFAGVRAADARAFVAQIIARV